MFRDPLCAGQQRSRHSGELLCRSNVLARVVYEGRGLQSPDRHRADDVTAHEQRKRHRREGGQFRDGLGHDRRHLYAARSVVGCDERLA